MDLELFFIINGPEIYPTKIPGAKAVRIRIHTPDQNQ